MPCERPEEASERSRKLVIHVQMLRCCCARAETLRSAHHRSRAELELNANSRNFLLFIFIPTWSCFGSAVHRHLNLKRISLKYHTHMGKPAEAPARDHHGSARWCCWMWHTIKSVWEEQLSIWTWMARGLSWENALSHESTKLKKLRWFCSGPRWTWSELEICSEVKFPDLYRPVESFQLCLLAVLLFFFLWSAACDFAIIKYFLHHRFG